MQRAVTPTTNDVREFWNNNPLFTGESTAETGTKEWFLEHEHVYFDDCLPLGIEPIYTQGLTPKSKILDIGCGPGFWVRHFLLQGYTDVSACDLTPNAVQLTQKSLEIFHLHTTGHIIEGDAENLPFDDEVFDHINCQGVVHHTPNTEKCIAEFARVLKPGGVACFSVYYKNIILRNNWLLKAVNAVFHNVVSLKGRGRDKILTSDAEELVRRYDGIGNPVGKSYTLPDLNLMVDPYFIVDNVQRTFFPARALSVKIPKAIHIYLHKKHGLLIVLRMTKRK